MINYKDVDPHIKIQRRQRSHLIFYLDEAWFNADVLKTLILSDDN